MEQICSVLVFVAYRGESLLWSSLFNEWHRSAKVGNFFFVFFLASHAIVTSIVTQTGL